MELSVASIAEKIGGTIVGDKNLIIHGAGSFEDAPESYLTFAGNAKYLDMIHETSAGAVLVPPSFEAEGKTIIQVENPRLSFLEVLKMFNKPVKPQAFLSPSANIGSNLKQGENVYIGPSCVVEDGVTIGDNVVISAGVFIGANVVIGNDVKICPNVTIMNDCLIGDRVIINPGCVVGSDGFGFVPDGVTHCKIPHTGIVQIDDDVEIGAGNMIDRATFGKTWIKKGVKTDNLVHIAHNVEVGENTLLVGQSGVAGSAVIGNNVIVAGQAGVSGHITVGNHVIIGPKAGIAKDVPDGQVISGMPGIAHRLWLRVQNLISKLPDMKKQLSDIERRLKAVEEKK